MEEPAFVAFYVAKGADIIFTGTQWTSSAKITPANITGWAIRVKAQRKDGTVVLDTPATVTDGPNGKYTWSVSHTVSNITTGLLKLDIFRSDSGFETPMVIGTLKLGADVRWGV